MKILFAKTAQGLSKFYHEVLLLKKNLQTKPQVEIMNNNYYDLYYTVKKIEMKKIMYIMIMKMTIIILMITILIIILDVKILLRY